MNYIPKIPWTFIDSKREVLIPEKFKVVLVRFEGTAYDQFVFALHKTINNRDKPKWTFTDAWTSSVLAYGDTQDEAINNALDKMEEKAPSSLRFAYLRKKGMQLIRDKNFKAVLDKQYASLPHEKVIVIDFE